MSSLYGLITASGILLAASPANAQLGEPRDEVETVLNRPRPGYDPLGVSLGGFLLFPKVAATIVYDDNIYASDIAKKSDGVVTIQPQLSLRSRWSRNRLNLNATADVRRNMTQKIEDTEQFGLTADGMLEVDSASQISLTTIYARRVEPRGFEDDIFNGLGEPIAYREIGATLSAFRTFGHVRLDAEGELSKYEYEDTRLNGQTINLSDRNYRNISGSLQATYAVGPNLGVFVSGSLDDAHYKSLGSDENRDSHGYSVLGGVSFGVTSLITGQAGIGYLSESYDDPIFAPIKGLNYNVRLAWNPTPLLTIQGKMAKSIQRSRSIDSAGIEFDDFSVVADYELLRNLLLKATLEYEKINYNGTDRKEGRITGGLRGQYQFTRNLAVTLAGNAVRQRRQASASAGRSYDRKQLSVGVVVQF
jgi:hypothetical protein